MSKKSKSKRKIRNEHSSARTAALASKVLRLHKQHRKVFEQMEKALASLAGSVLAQARDR